VGEHVQEVFERQIRVAARDGLAKRQVEHYFNRWRKHQASSTVA
jgi:hypothetical protein